jgi:hypothetical protein
VLMTLEGQTEADQVNAFVLDVAVEDIEVVAVVTNGAKSVHTRLAQSGTPGACQPGVCATRVYQCHVV